MSRALHSIDCRPNRVTSGAIVAGLLLIAAVPCQAHPASHVDAWARVGSRLDVRLIVFLDNVLRQQDVTSESALISPEAAQQALRQFEDSLPQLLSFYDEQGRVLQPEVVRRPRWSPSDQGVDLTADGALRLSWQLRYPWKASHQTFVIRHSFVQHQAQGTSVPAVDGSPCELRLRVRRAAGGPRVSAVVADHQSHRVVLPTMAGQAEVDSAPPLPQARFVLLPGRLVHEFSLPWELVPAATQRANQQPGTVDPQIVNWARQSCELSVNGRSSAAQTTSVQLLTQDDELLSDADPASIVGLRLGIRTVHPVPDELQQVDVQWTSGLESVEKVQLDTLHGETASTQIVSRPQPDAAGSHLTYSWGVAVQTLTPPRSAVAELTTGKAAETVKSDSLWVAQPSARRRYGPTLAGLTVVACLAFGRLRRQRQSKLAGIFGLVAITLGLVAAVGVVTGLLNEPLKPDSRMAGNMLNGLLNQVYQTVLISDERVAVGQLHDVLTADLAEAVYLQAASALHSSEDDAPFVRVSDVHIVQCTADRFQAPNWASFHCEWEISGQVLHWGHRHQRTMKLQGIIRLDSSGDDCHVSDISLQGITTTVATAGT